MKIHILSDLHLEFASFNPPKTNADIVVLAGDIHLGQKGLEWAKEFFPDKTVLYVLGNHEYYGKAIPKLTDKLREQVVGTRIHILENDSFEFENFKFLGCTLWTDFKLFEQPRISAYQAQSTITDYRKIRVNPKFSKLRPIDTMRFHANSLSWLKKQLDNNHKKTIVMTHHAPSLRSLPITWQKNLLSAAYASPLDDFVSNSNISLWIHGHIHQSIDYQLNNTRIVCNPRGYPDENSSGFDSDLVIEV
ncbi:metallophosphoesterase [Candidatus Parabeggiatoa sp. HSG14]|uniref:metallophosphoesterase n=1 Tax=Candidatus Parabeggiatoa sp. HSG14 TaxID=3055593 RepID=UPI0025A6E7EC|nr:metallophosphoesterase [Thiotrichales bacterium HSG14]